MAGAGLASKLFGSMAGDASGGLGSLAGTLAAVALAEPIVDNLSGLAIERYKNINTPTWQAMGANQLYGDYLGLIEFQRRNEALMKLKYDKPVEVGGELAGEAVKEIGRSMKGVSNDYKATRAFDMIENTPQVRALGKEKARQIFDQVAALSPNVIRKAPNVALSIMNDAIMTDSTALRPETAQNLARASSELSKIQ